MDFFDESGVDMEGFNKYWGNYREVGQYSEIENYIKYHNAIDRFVWILRLMYSDRKTIKTRKYRLDKLLQHYIVKNEIKIDNRFNKLIGANYSKDDFIYYMKQGWYNELAISYPFDENPLDIGTNVNKTKLNVKIDLFPSWHIIKSYYAIYSF